jgi:hypothetical protein
MRKRKLLLTMSTVLVLALIFITANLCINKLLEVAKANYGVYATPELGMSALLGDGHHPIEAQYIRYSGPNCFIVCNPHVWFIHVAGNGRGGGAYFVQTEDGWVHLPESAFPDFIGLGMILFGLTP